MAAQIKSGNSYLIDKGDHFAFYPKEKHKNYWAIFPLPVILLVYYPKDENIYFTDVRYQLNIPNNNLTYIKIPKHNILNKQTSTLIFETTGDFASDLLPIEEVLHKMCLTNCQNVTFYINYLDLFTQGLTNFCRHIYFSMDLALKIAEYNNNSDFGLGLGDTEHQFLHNYARFLIGQNLANIDYSDYLIDWKEREIQPTFIASLTKRGRDLLKYIKHIQSNHQDNLPPTQLVRERPIEMIFRTQDDYLRLELGKKIKEIIIKTNG